VLIKYKHDNKSRAKILLVFRICNRLYKCMLGLYYSGRITGARGGLAPWKTGWPPRNTWFERVQAVL